MDAATARRAIDDMWEAYNQRDIDRWVGFCAPDVSVTDIGGLRIGSRAEFKDYVRAWFDCSTDARVTVIRTIVEGNHAAAELRLEGTHDGAPLYDLEASGAHLDNTWVIHVEFVNDLVQELRIFNNPARFLEQLGIIEPLPVRPT